MKKTSISHDWNAVQENLFPIPKYLNLQYFQFYVQIINYLKWIMNRKNCDTVYDLDNSIICCRKKSWTEAEDELLIQLVEQNFSYGYWWVVVLTMMSSTL